jgi:hypothetical protein
MKHIAIALLSLGLQSFCWGQVEHAPTKDQCRADLAVWSEEVMGFGKDASFDQCFPGVMAGQMTCIRVGMRKSLDALREELREMLACDSVDPGYERGAKYTYVGWTQPLQLEESYRLQHFIKRHKLWEEYRLAADFMKSWEAPIKTTSDAVMRVGLQNSSMQKFIIDKHEWAEFNKEDQSLEHRVD